MLRSLSDAILLGILILVSEPLLAQHDPSAPVESLQHELHACLMEAGEAPSAMLTCAEMAEEGWQEQIARLDGRLARALGKEAREALSLSNEAWRASRDTNQRLLKRYYTQLEEAELGAPDRLQLAQQLQRNALLEARVNLLLRLLEGLGSLPDLDMAPSSS